MERQDHKHNRKLSIISDIGSEGDENDVIEKDISGSILENKLKPGKISCHSEERVLNESKVYECFLSKNINRNLITNTPGSRTTRSE